MADVVTPEKRSQMMAGIRGKDTQPELLLRRGLHRMGFRYQLHRKDLPGKPDLVFPRYKAVLFVHGCFWHGHECHLFKWPKSRSLFWHKKIAANQVRDEAVVAQLLRAGWRVGEVWECSTKGPLKLHSSEVLQAVSQWLHSNESRTEITGSAETRKRACLNEVRHV